MINTLLRWLFPQQRTDLQVVLDKIAGQQEVRSARIAMSMDGNIKPLDINSDLNFMVGKPSFSTGYTFKYFLVQFNTGDTGCIIKLKGDDMPLFAFDDPEEVKQIRKAIVDKYNEMVELEFKNKRRTYAQEE